MIFIDHILIFLQISIVCLFLAQCGFLLKKFIFLEHDNKNFEENGLFGFLLVGFISLTINFFYPLNVIVNNIIFVLLFIVSFLANYFDQNKIKLIKKIFFISFFCYILIIYSNVNTPDALLYHLPYSKIINEEKIIFGLSNIHFRFGFISIFQYISSFFNNSLLKENGVLIPIGLLVSYFFIYCYRLFKSDFKKDLLRPKSYYTFLILIFSLYSFNRYSGYGNDAQTHIFYFFGILYLLDFITKKKDLLVFKKLSLIFLFTFFTKASYLITLIIPFVIFLLIRKNYIIIKSKFFVFSFLFITFWLMKSFFTTGCLIYPEEKTCFKNVVWFDSSVQKISAETEAWAKAWPRNLNRNLSHAEYNKDLNWASTWLNSHLFIIIEKISPVLIFLIINFLFFYLTRCLKKNYQNSNNKSYFSIFFISLIFLFVWFLKFPTYRFGVSFIYTFIIFSIYFIFIRKIDFIKIKKYYNFFIFFIITLTCLIVAKNVNRILETNNKQISPHMFDPLDQGNYTKIFNKDKIFTYYNKDKACGYSAPPCSNTKIELIKEIFLGYTIYYTY